MKENNTRYKAIIETKLKEIEAILNTKESIATLKIREITEPLVKNNLLINFIEFLERNENRVGLEYKTGYQKLLILHKEYETSALKAMLKDKMSDNEKKAHKIAKKVKMATNAYEDAEAKRLSGRTYFKQLHYRSFKGLFEEHEILLLEKIGKIGKAILLQKSVSGIDKLEEKILSMLNNIEYKNAKLLIASTKKTEKTNGRVMGLIGNKIDKG